MHYADGTEAKVGDLVKGTCYNTKNADGTDRVIVGEMLEITPGSDTCNCKVAFVEASEASIEAWTKMYNVTPHLVSHLNRGALFLVPKVDYSECKAFTLVHRPGA